LKFCQNFAKDVVSPEDAKEEVMLYEPFSKLFHKTPSEVKPILNEVLG
jgi:hypothetical protein